MGLLGPDTTYIHCNYLSDDEFQLIADTGGKVSISPSVEMSMGHGTPPTAKALAHGLRPSLEHRRRHDRAGRHVHADAVPLRLRPAARARGGVRGRERPRSPSCSSSREVLEFATIEGARVCGLEERTGSLTPGKQADVVVVRCDHSNTYPVIDPVSTVVHQADTRNVDTVIVAGEFLKRGRQARRRRPAPRARRRGRLARLPAAAHDHPAALGPELPGEPTRRGLEPTERNDRRRHVSRQRTPSKEEDTK